MTRSRPPPLADYVERATQRIHTGETPSAAEYDCADSEELAELRELLGIVELLQEAGTASSASAASAVDSSPSAFPSENAELGDYRLLREIGRGGMGIVYEAEQISLRRRVAIKLLPRVSTLDSKRLRRFKNEAQAAAGLDHPNIVPIYSVGCAENIHYYAMPLVDGQSLATLIAHLVRLDGEIVVPSSAASHGSETDVNLADDPCHQTSWFRPKPYRYYRAVAWLGLQAADALQHTHEAGLIHRDVKPSNLLVTREGHLWVTDFGLARLPGDTTLTVSGELVGTARFMSPEQGQAKPAAVDHRTDIYSLGATLYELLTLQPAFAGNDRQELLSRISTTEPRAPRRIDKSIPRDLETIVLKAMAKASDERYASARELADDLQRFLRHEVIRGQPPSILDRTLKLTRRHAPAIASVLLVLAVVVITLSISTVTITRERNAAQDAAEHATASFQQAHQLVDEMFERAAYDLAGVPHSDPIRHALLEDALQFYLGLHRQHPTDAEVVFDTARAFDRVGEIHARLGDFVEAERAFLLAREMFGRLTKQQPAEAKHQVSFAENLRGLANLRTEQAGRLHEAEKLMHQRVQLLADLLEEFPDEPAYRCKLASALTDRANLFVESGRLDEAEVDFREALVLREQNEAEMRKVSESCLGLVSTLHGLGELLLSTCRLSEAGRHLLQAFTLQRELVGASPYDDQLRYDLAHIEHDLGRLYCHSNQPDAAEKHLRHAISVCEQLVHDYPDAVEYRFRIASTWQGLSRTLVALQRRDEAREALDHSIGYLAPIVGGTGGNLDELLLLADNYFLSGTRYRQANQSESADEAFRECQRLLESCTAKFPEAARPQSHLAHFLVACPDPSFWDATRAVELSLQAAQRVPQQAHHWRVLGMARYRTGAWKASAEALLKAQELNRGGDGFDWFLLAMVHARLQELEEAQRWYQMALRCSQHNRWDGEQLALLKAEAAELFEELRQTPIP